MTTADAGGKGMHTQGEWRVDDSEDARIVVRAEDGQLIADCTDGFYNNDGDWVMAADAEPNARLIAAAPDLLAALLAFRDGGISGGKDFAGWHDSYSLAIKKARAAIARATEGQS
jgi:hypothetical protein